LNQIHETNRWFFDKGIPTRFGFAQSANGQWMAMGLIDGMVYRWQVGHPGWSEVRLNIDDGIASLDISDDGQRLVAATADGVIKLWDDKDDQIRDFSVDKPVGGLLRVRLSPDGQKLAVMSPPGILQLWKVDTRESRAVSQNNSRDRVMNVWFSPNSKKLAIAGMHSDGKPLIQVLDSQGNLLADLPVSGQRPIRELRFSPDGQTLATVAFGDKSATLWNLQGQQIATFKGHRSAIGSLSFSPDGQQLATGAADGFARVWDLNGNEKLVLKGHGSEVAALGFSQDEQELTTVTSLGTVRLWSLAERGCTATNPSCKVFTIPSQGLSQFQGLTEVAFSRDGKVMVAGARNGSAYLWTAGQTKLLRTFKGNNQSSFRTKPRVFLSPDGEQLATIASDGTAQLWSSQNEGSAQQLFKGTDKAWAVAVDLNGDRFQFATASEEDVLSIRDSRGQILGSPFNVKGGKLQNAAFSPNGQIIATVGKDNIPRLWNLKGRLLAELGSHSGQVSDISFSLDGQKLAISFLDGTVLVSNLQGRSVLDSPIQNGSSVLSVRFSPDGQTLATASFDSRARIWNLQGQQLAEYQSETGLWNASFSPDGKQLAAVGWGNQGWLWSVYDLDQLLNQGCDWMQDYLTTHPDAAKDLTVCHD
jgi:WD40 repeat protein